MRPPNPTPRPLSIAISPDATTVYTGTTGRNGVVAFSRDLSSGRLASLAAPLVPSDVFFSYTYGLAVSPDGLNVYAANSGNSSVVVFARDPLAGELVYEQQLRDNIDIGNLSGATSAAASLDGQSVYVTAFSDDSVITFARAAANGRLTGGPPLGIRIDGARSVAVSPDDRHVYVAGRNSHSVVVFERDARGDLAPASALNLGALGLEAYVFPMALNVSPDGAHVYVAAWQVHAVIVLARDAVTGSLTHVGEDIVRAPGDLSRLLSPIDLAVSADGERVYVVAQYGDALFAFDRDPATGKLMLVDLLRHGEGVDGVRVEGLRNPHAVSVTSDDANLYVASPVDGAVGVFAVNLCGNGAVDPGEECDDGNLDPLDDCDGLCLVEEKASGSGTATTDGESDGATAADPIETTVDSPLGGDVEIVETSATEPAPAGFVIAGRRVLITAPAATAAAPLVLTFRLDASLVPSGPPPPALALFKDGVLVADCSGLPGEASPDPCVASRTLLGDGDVEIVALSSAASTWTLAFPEPPCGNGALDAGEECDDGNRLDGDCCSSACAFEPAGGERAPSRLDPHPRRGRVRRRRVLAGERNAGAKIPRPRAPARRGQDAVAARSAACFGADYATPIRNADGVFRAKGE